MPLVFVPPQLRDLTNGTERLNIPAQTVAEVVEELERRFPGVRARLCAGEQLAPGLQVSVDHTLTRQGLLAQLSPASEVHFLPAFGGG